MKKLEGEDLVDKPIGFTIELYVRLKPTKKSLTEPLQECKKPRDSKEEK